MNRLGVSIGLLVSVVASAGRGQAASESRSWTQLHPLGENGSAR